MFLSINLLKNGVTSYKDDLISVFYLLVYILCDQRIVNQEAFLINPKQMLLYREENPMAELPMLLVDHLVLFGPEQDLLPEKISK